MTPVANFLAFFALVCAMLLVWRQSWPGRLRLFVAQSLCLALLCAALGTYANRRGLFAVAAAFALLKCWGIPRALRRIAAGAPVRPVAPGKSAGIPLLVSGGLVLAAYAIVLPVARTIALPTRDAIPLAFAAALIGLYVCVTGRDAFGQILGFLAFENGIFGVALVAAYGLPGIVEAGVFLDVLVIVLITEGLVRRIRREHDSIAVDRLRDLRG
jgi:hydrogenase-4 component E